MNKENRKYSGWDQGKSNNTEGKCKDEDGKYCEKLFDCFKCGKQQSSINKQYNQQYKQMSCIWKKL